MTSDFDRFPLQHGDLRWPARQPASELESNTATRWSLHLRCGDTLASVKRVAAAIWNTHAVCLIGYFGGDSFLEWCEPFDQEDGQAQGQSGRALHVVFNAPDVDSAIRTGQAMAKAAGITSAADAGITPSENHDQYFAIFEEEA